MRPVELLGLVAMLVAAIVTTAAAGFVVDWWLHR